MKQSAMSYKTKSSMASALRESLKKEDFKKISIRTITDTCKINRQTFYYHFRDIYDLLEWAIEEDITDFIERQENPLYWNESLPIIFNYLTENKEMAVNAYNSIGHERFFSLLNEKLYDTICLIVQHYCKNFHISEKSVDFISAYYMITLTGIIESYLTGHLSYTPLQICDMLNKMLISQIEGAKSRYLNNSN